MRVQTLIFILTSITGFTLAINQWSQTWALIFLGVVSLGAALMDLGLSEQ